MTLLSAENLSLAHGGRILVNRVDLVARAGHLTAIAGPNGVGKTTLFRALTGEIAVQASARIALNGTMIGRYPIGLLAGIRAVLAQSVRMAFPFTVREVVGLGQSSGFAADRPDVTDLALERVGLADFGRRTVNSLSGGEQARVHLARVLAQVWDPVGPEGPSWLFLDEPVASLDIGHQLLVMDIARAFADAGGGVVTVMHDLNLTAMYADRVLLMAPGKVLAQGTPRDVLTNAHLSQAYRCQVKVNQTPVDGPFILPQAAARQSLVRGAL